MSLNAVLVVHRWCLECVVCLGHAPSGHLAARARARHRVGVIVYGVVDDALSPDFPLGVELEVFIRREDSERFVEEVRGDVDDVGVGDDDGGLVG